MINHEPDSYCLPLAQSTSHKPDKRLFTFASIDVPRLSPVVRGSYNYHHSNLFELVRTVRTDRTVPTVRTLRVRFEQVRSRPCTSLVDTNSWKFFIKSERRSDGA